MEEATRTQSEDAAPAQKDAAPPHAHERARALGLLFVDASPELVDNLARAASPKGAVVGAAQLDEYGAALREIGRGALDGGEDRGRVWLAYAPLGLLIGLLTGITSAEITTTLMTLLFTFVGGSVIALSSRLSGRQRAFAGAATSAMATLCLVGVIAGILIKEHRVLSPKRAPTAAPGEAASASPYLRGNLSDQVSQIHQLVHSNPPLSYAEAVTRLGAVARPDAIANAPMREAVRAILELREGHAIGDEEAYRRLHDTLSPPQ